jgi:hypothetical protein
MIKSGTVHRLFVCVKKYELIPVANCKHHSGSIKSLGRQLVPAETLAVKSKNFSSAFCAQGVSRER